MQNITVYAGEMTLDTPGAEDINDITEFELYSADGTLLETKRGEGTPPEQATFTIDENLSYYYRIRQHGATYGWGDWGETCEIRAPYILPPEFTLSEGLVPGSVDVSIDPMKVYRGTDTAKSLTISIEGEDGNKLQEYTLDGEPSSFTFQVLPTGHYIVSAYWTGNALGDGDSHNEEIDVLNINPVLLAPDFTITPNDHGMDLSLALPLKTDKDGVTDDLAQVHWVVYWLPSEQKIIDVVRTSPDLEVIGLYSQEEYRVECDVVGQRYGNSPVTAKTTRTLEEQCPLSPPTYNLVAETGGITVNNVLFGNGNQIKTDCGTFDTFDGAAYYVADERGLPIFISQGKIIQGKTFRIPWLTPNTLYTVYVYQKGVDKGLTPRSVSRTIRTLNDTALNPPNITVLANGNGVQVTYIPVSGTQLTTTSAGVFDTFNGLEVACWPRDCFNVFCPVLYWNAGTGYQRIIDLPEPGEYIVTARLRGQRFSGSPWTAIGYTKPG